MACTAAFMASTAAHAMACIIASCSVALILSLTYFSKTAFSVLLMPASLRPLLLMPCNVSYISEDTTNGCLYSCSLLACMLLCYSLVLHVCVLYIYNGGTLWWAIYRILIGHLSDTHDRLFIHTIYTTITDTHNITYNHS